MDNKETIPSRERSNANLKPTKKGERRNPKGRPPGKTIRQLIRETNTKEKQAIVNKMVALAKTGDVRAAEWIAKHGDVSSLLEVTTKDFTITLSHPGDSEDVD